MACQGPSEGGGRERGRAARPGNVWLERGCICPPIPAPLPPNPPHPPPPLLPGYFNQPAAQGMGLGDPANLMAHQVPFRTAGGAYGGQQQPVLASANLFSSILLPEPSTMLESGLRGGDSDDSSGEQDGGGPRRKGDKSQAIQEKNRRAQKRFRERQVRPRLGG